jgi:ethanolaminephosphotransferase
MMTPRMKIDISGTTTTPKTTAEAVESTTTTTTDPSIQMMMMDPLLLNYSTVMMMNNGDAAAAATAAADAVEQKEGSDDSSSSSYSYFYYLSDSAARHLPRFQYKGQDRSYTYQYVLSPWAEYLVRSFVPPSVAPNTITAIGLSFMVASYCTFWYARPSVLLLLSSSSASSEENHDNDDVPRWMFLMNAICILVYQTLDNMDGKQARRVRASSPLGLLFDHGCDAVNSLFGSANWMICMALTTQDVQLCFWVLFAPYAVFFIGTWEEYHTGELIMPVFNGPNEGLLGAVIMSLLSFRYGPLYWQSYSWWDSMLVGVYLPFLTPLKNCELLIWATKIACVQEITLKIISVVRKHGIRVLTSLLPFVTLVTCAILVGQRNHTTTATATSPSSSNSSTATTTSNLWLDHPRTSLHLCAILFVEMTTALMLQHTTHQPYPSFRWILVPLVLLTVWVLLCSSANDDDSSSSTTTTQHFGFTISEYLLVYTAVAGTYLVLKTKILIHEICIVLNVWCFDIVTPRPPSRPQLQQQKQQQQRLPSMLEKQEEVYLLSPDDK